MAYINFIAANRNKFHTIRFFSSNKIPDNHNHISHSIAVLVNALASEGAHVVEFNAKSLPGGAYFYKLQSGNSVSVKKMLLLK